jgi:hypothetical protein
MIQYLNDALRNKRRSLLTVASIVFSLLLLCIRFGDEAGEGHGMREFYTAAAVLSPR